MNPNFPPRGPDFMAAIRRPSTLLMIIGGLTLVMGMCLSIGMFLPTEQYQVIIKQMPRPEGAPEVTVSTLRAFYGVMAFAGIAAGIVFFILGFYVRRAKRVAIVFAVVLCGIAVLFLAFGELQILLAVGQTPMVAPALVIFLVPLVLFGMATAWLMRALKVLPHIEAARRQWQANYAASQQQQSLHQISPGYPPLQDPQGGYAPLAAPPQNYPQAPQGYSQQAYMPPAIGYGAMPPVQQQPPAQSGPPVRHPPLPPDQGSGNPPVQG